MDISVSFYEDAQAFSAAAKEFLLSRKVLHNLILTIVDSRLTRPEAGHYWVAVRANEVVGVALQSPLTYPATVAPMQPDVTAALVDAIADTGFLLPGVNGEVATAASFAGRWTERHKSAAFPVQGLRLYELEELKGIVSSEGELRKANTQDRNLAITWLQEFYIETRTPASNAENLIDAALREERLWLWQDGSVVSMAISSKPVQGVVRVSAVYTPPANRKQGYAAACVHGISKYFRSEGYYCMLYTDLGNPTSNSIYRKIGYKAIAEAIHYRFDNP
jgi:GNAT superfamily N-acetyltransferase